MRNILIFLLMTMMISSCELFHLREAEPASEDALWNEPAATLPLALENLKFAYEDSRNAMNYSRLFHPDFRFYFASQDISDFSIDPDWNRAREQDMLLNLHSRFEKMDISLTDLVDTPDEMSGNSARIYRSYTIKASRQQQMQGKLELHYLSEHGRWFIEKWYDYRCSNCSSEVRTWGVLKHENR